MINAVRVLNALHGGPPHLSPLQEERSASIAELLPQCFHGEIILDDANDTAGQQFIKRIDEHVDMF